MNKKNKTSTKKMRSHSTGNTLQPNKLLGQHFLRSEKTIDAIILAAHIQPTDTIVEVGPGKGILTKEIVSRAERVIAIEKDPRLAEHIRETFLNAHNLETIDGDILRIDRESLGLKESSYSIVANLPYYLTSHFLRIFLELSPRPSMMTLMIQKEVAQRIIAKPPQMNMIALAVQAFGKPRIVARVPKEFFSPRPKVDSAVISISDISEKFFIDNDISSKDFFQLAKKAFAQKRKMLRNSIGVSLEKRPQELSLDDWVSIVKTSSPDR